MPHMAEVSESVSVSAFRCCIFRKSLLNDFGSVLPTVALEEKKPNETNKIKYQS